ncbi:carbon-nitrogen hydrolase family protein [Clostridium butyricum]|uniref:Nitrilase/cyanide hydratase and apolipoprotein N-acyltransferase n=1 Tax=Clostridium butyricum E4 str. BoNT E BL5262 TaxID=632245 RepID=C4IGF9_CLOBU|nr:carbon-nitrogen hydrolase family protein [Clostridium butyricum]EEP54937.1 nitrilase/cyanide hydratase and apolipoprotein N-acyltransferase [Clostridium butyricum E4 str. BoNT E BL5262]NFL30463.1 carbon-nitrogen hydrolase family protein [Clostridium butyricum]NFS17247.1 carbon-nitrogen hydrolase family protein [Clostridium butyricum]
MNKDIINLSLVTFNAVWGDKEKNLNRILGYIECAARKGSHFVVFPEMSLTGYGDEGEKEKKDKMQSLLAETIPGPSTDKVAEACKKYDIYVVFGMPERDSDDSSIIYNALAIFSPEGLVGSYRKMHLPAPEPNWATRGDKPFILETPWGPIGYAICYDSYCFPELMRYYASKGCRLYINSTALAKCHGKCLGTSTLEAAVIREGIYIASANLGGLDVDNYFWGGSSIIGPSRKTWEPYYYAGHKFTDEVADESEMFSATIDLSLATRFLYKDNLSVNGTDWRPDKYIDMYKDAINNPEYGK